jgi:co-chaperonin GroES (HSP10)
MAKAKKATLTLIRDNIFFQFEEDAVNYRDGKTTQRGFREVTAGGLIVVSPPKSANSARFGIVTHVGPEVKEDIRVGDRILVDALKWTEEVKFEGQGYWMTREEHVIGIDESKR